MILTELPAVEQEPRVNYSRTVVILCSSQNTVGNSISAVYTPFHCLNPGHSTLKGQQKWVMVITTPVHGPVYESRVQVLKYPAQASLEHCCSGCAHDEMQSSGEEAGLFDESDGW